MKITSIIILISALAFWLFNKPENSIEKSVEKTAKPEVTLQNSVHISKEKLSVVKSAGNLIEIENQLQKFKSLSYDDFTQEDLKNYNELVLQRAIILKKQIFSKAAKMGYYL